MKMETLLTTITAGVVFFVLLVIVLSEGGPKAPVSLSSDEHAQARRLKELCPDLSTWKECAERRAAKKPTALPTVERKREPEPETLQLHEIWEDLEDNQARAQSRFIGKRIRTVGNFVQASEHRDVLVVQISTIFNDSHILACAMKDRYRPGVLSLTKNAGVSVEMTPAEFTNGNLFAKDCDLLPTVRPN